MVPNRTIPQKAKTMQKIAAFTVPYEQQIEATLPRLYNMYNDVYLPKNKLKTFKLFS